MSKRTTKTTLPMSLRLPVKTEGNLRRAARANALNVHATAVLAMDIGLKMIERDFKSLSVTLT